MARKRRTPYWTSAIETALERRARGEVPFTPAVKRDAKDWKACACAQQPGAILRAPGGWPRDMALAELGCRFLRAVSDQNPEKAREILGRIEARAQEIEATS